MGVRVVTDSACDVPDAVLAEMGVSLIPLSVRFGNEELVDRVELSAEQFWVKCLSSPQLPQTAAPSPGSFAKVFSDAAKEDAQGVVCVCLSSELSATFEAASQAAREVEGVPIAVIDTRSATIGEGLVVLAAARAAARGSDHSEVVAAAETAKSTLSVFGAIDTLDNLKRGGRIGGAAALLGSLLAIKPVIEVRDGKVEQESKQRTRIKSLRYIADKALSAGPLDQLAITGTNSQDIETMQEMLSSVKCATEPMTSLMGPVIGTHAGPGAVGVAWTLPA